MTSGTAETGAAPFLRFDFADTLGLPRPLCFARPVRVIAAHRVGDVRAAIREVEEGTRQGLYAAGYVAYEAAPAFDEALTTHARCDVPLVWFGLFREPVDSNVLPRGRATDGSSRGTYVVPEQVGRAGVASLQAAAWEPDVSREAYARGIDAVRAAIARGDSYQVNYTFRLHGQLPGETAAFDALYRHLSAVQQVPYAALLDLGAWRVLSLSPELFFRRRGRHVTTRPMKGTVPRGRWPEEDRAQAAWLAASPKNRAENVMIVDLARNDVGRIAEVGSVRPSSLFDVERYPSVFQMVSTVEGTLRDGTTLDDLFAALFPAGSITGAPKSSSMGLIAALEQAPRGVYCGAIGFVVPGGDAIFSVAIRTAVMDTRTGAAEYGVGGGVTWDSTAEGEYAEALSKAEGLSVAPPFALLETMRLDEGVYARLDRHLRRLDDSARYWASCGLFSGGVHASRGDSHPAIARAARIGSGVARPSDASDAPVSMAAVRAALDAEAREHPAGAWRVRLRVFPGNGIQIESTRLTPLGARPPGALPPGTGPLDSGSSGATSSDRTTDERSSRPFVALARTPVCSRDRFLLHKTTHRVVYDAQRAAHPDAFDVLLWNERRELTEFTIGNAIVEIDGVRITPSRGSGLLGGTLRAELLDAGEIQERTIAVDELPSVTRIWVINSVRGWIEVRLR